MGAQTAPASSGSQTQTSTQPVLRLSAPSGTLRLRAEPVERRHIQWAEDVVDNEGMGKKSSKGTHPSNHVSSTVQNQARNRLVRQRLTRKQCAAFTILSARSASHPTSHPAILAAILIRIATWTMGRLDLQVGGMDGGVGGNTVTATIISMANTITMNTMGDLQDSRRRHGEDLARTRMRRCPR